MWHSPRVHQGKNEMQDTPTEHSLNSLGLGQTDTYPWFTTVSGLATTVAVDFDLLAPALLNSVFLTSATTTFCKCNLHRPLCRPRSTSKVGTKGPARRGLLLEYTEMEEIDLAATGAAILKTKFSRKNQKGRKHQVQPSWLNFPEVRVSKNATVFLCDLPQNFRLISSPRLQLEFVCINSFKRMNTPTTPQLIEFYWGFGFPSEFYSVLHRMFTSSSEVHELLLESGTEVSGVGLVLACRIQPCNCWRNNYEWSFIKLLQQRPETKENVRTSWIRPQECEFRHR